MEDFDAALRIVIFEGIVTVGRDGNNLFYSRFLKEGQIVLRQFFEEGLLTHPSNLVSTAGLFLSQDSQVKTYSLKDLHKSLRNIPVLLGRRLAYSRYKIASLFFLLR